MKQRPLVHLLRNRHHDSSSKLNRMGCTHDSAIRPLGNWYCCCLTQLISWANPIRTENWNFNAFRIEYSSSPCSFVIINLFPENHSTIYSFATASRAMRSSQSVDFNCLWLLYGRCTLSTRNNNLQFHTRPSIAVRWQLIHLIAQRSNVN